MFIYQSTMTVQPNFISIDFTVGVLDVRAKAVHITLAIVCLDFILHFIHHCHLVFFIGSHEPLFCRLMFEQSITHPVFVN